MFRSTLRPDGFASGYDNAADSSHRVLLLRSRAHRHAVQTQREGRKIEEANYVMNHRLNDQANGKYRTTNMIHPKRRRVKQIKARPKSAYGIMYDQQYMGGDIEDVTTFDGEDERVITLLQLRSSHHPVTRRSIPVAFFPASPSTVRLREEQERQRALLAAEAEQTAAIAAVSAASSLASTARSSTPSSSSMPLSSPSSHSHPFSLGFSPRSLTAAAMSLRRPRSAFIKASVPSGSVPSGPSGPSGPGARPNTASKSRPSTASRAAEQQQQQQQAPAESPTKHRATQSKVEIMAFDGGSQSERLPRNASANERITLEQIANGDEDDNDDISDDEPELHGAEYYADEDIDLDQMNAQLTIVQQSLQRPHVPVRALAAPDASLISSTQPGPGPAGANALQSPTIAKRQQQHHRQLYQQHMAQMASQHHLHQQHQQQQQQQQPMYPSAPMSSYPPQSSREYHAFAHPYPPHSQPQLQMAPSQFQPNPLGFANTPHSRQSSSSASQSQHYSDQKEPDYAHDIAAEQYQQQYNQYQQQYQHYPQSHNPMAHHHPAHPQSFPQTHLSQSYPDPHHRASFSHPQSYYSSPFQPPPAMVARPPSAPAPLGPAAGGMHHRPASAQVHSVTPYYPYHVRASSSPSSSLTHQPSSQSNSQAHAQQQSSSFPTSPLPQPPASYLIRPHPADASADPQRAGAGGVFMLYPRSAAVVMKPASNEQLSLLSAPLHNVSEHEETKNVTTKPNERGLSYTGYRRHSRQHSRQASMDSSHASYSSQPNESVSMTMMSPSTNEPADHHNRHHRRTPSYPRRHSPAPPPSSADPSSHHRIHQSNVAQNGQFHGRQ